MSESGSSNRSTATYECIFGRGCDGICCRSGRPPLFAPDIARIEPHLEKFIPHLRPEAAEVLNRDGYRAERIDAGEASLRVVGDACIFFNQGCVLHKVGAMEGDKYKYKPARCALFPLARDPLGQWFVRQHGVAGEQWDLFCLDPKASSVSAQESLREEWALAQKLDSSAT